ncbi:MAG: type II toxin-antitoxin system Phd/YefM family antitoxin [Cyanobacteria bacterium]|nr:type II toxin-antitoxin system Phd/YefM family antitoxin [Cyanobacteriota bacterium]
METLVSATELARKLGDYLARVRYRRESLLIERNGKPVARIVPVEDGEPATLGLALAAWCGAGPVDGGFADDLEKVNAADVPPGEPWDS